MKLFLFRTVWTLLFLFSCFSCMHDIGSYALTEKMYFDAKGGIQETEIVRRDKSVKGEESWFRSFVYFYDNNDKEVFPEEVCSPVLLSTGEYELNYGWVKFYYPKTKHKIRVEVAPNQTGKNRKARFHAPSYNDAVSIKIFQSAQ